MEEPKQGVASGGVRSEKDDAFVHERARNSFVL
jgi:hypothetical protein